MTTTIVNVKVDPSLKKQARKVAENLGFSLSGVINAYLKHLVRTKTVSFSMTEEIPSDYLIKVMREAEEDVRAGRVSPAFTNAKDAIKWLNSKDKKYAGKI